MRAAPPVSTVLLFTGLVLPFALILVGPVSILPLAVGLIVLVGAGVGISALPLPKPVVPRVLVLVLLQAAVGVLLAAVCALGLLLAGGDPSWAWFQAITYPVVALAVAFVVSLSIRVRQDQAELESALQANIAATARVRSEYERERAALARLLHAGVQSELIAGALSLTASPGNGPVTAAQRIAEVVGRAGRRFAGETRSRTRRTRCAR
ncbi:hypothetical protein ACRAWC_24070 [Leifsonia sp. L25]|uniref:hypothetical protein n=1 Tax=Leifsonia sp. L25 TaxID=3423957 RepID=UPI003D690E06